MSFVVAIKHPVHRYNPTISANNVPTLQSRPTGFAALPSSTAPLSPPPCCPSSLSWRHTKARRARCGHAGCCPHHHVGLPLPALPLLFPCSGSRPAEVLPQVPDVYLPSANPTLNHTLQRPATAQRQSPLSTCPTWWYRSCWQCTCCWCRGRLATWANRKASGSKPRCGAAWTKV
jgi:hypothetical protein